MLKLLFKKIPPMLLATEGGQLRSTYRDGESDMCKRNGEAKVNSHDQGACHQRTGQRAQDSTEGCVG